MKKYILLYIRIQMNVYNIYRIILLKKKYQEYQIYYKIQTAKKVIFSLSTKTKKKLNKRMLYSVCKNYPLEMML